MNWDARVSDLRAPRPADEDAVPYRSRRKNKGCHKNQRRSPRLPDLRLDRWVDSLRRTTSGSDRSS